MIWRFETRGYFIAYNLATDLRRVGFTVPFGDDQLDSRNNCGYYELDAVHLDPEQAIIELLKLDLVDVTVREIALT